MKPIYSIALAATLALFPFTASAQDNCGPIEGMESYFQEQFGERVVYQAVDQNGTIFYFLVNDDTQGWTIVVSDGVIGCVVAAGQGVMMIPAGLAL